MDNTMIIWICIIIDNLFGFLLMGFDKYQANKGKWRIQEVRFFIIGLILGAPGIYLGMQVFRNKTQQKEFVYGIPILIIVNIVIINYLLQSV